MITQSNILHDIYIPYPYIYPTVHSDFLVCQLCVCLYLYYSPCLFQVGADSVKASNMSHGIKWVMRGMPVLIFPVIMNFPAVSGEEL